MFIDFLYINQNIRNIKRTLEIDKKNHVCRFIETRRLKKKKKEDGNENCEKHKK